MRVFFIEQSALILFCQLKRETEGTDNSPSMCRGSFSLLANLRSALANPLNACSQCCLSFNQSRNNPHKPSKSVKKKEKKKEETIINDVNKTKY